MSSLEEQVIAQIEASKEQLEGQERDIEAKRGRLKELDDRIRCLCKRNETEEEEESAWKEIQRLRRKEAKIKEEYERMVTFMREYEMEP